MGVALRISSVSSTRAACPQAPLPSLPPWSQDYAWLESQLPRKLAARPVQGEPLFCFETCLKSFYFSFLVSRPVLLPSCFFSIL